MSRTYRRVNETWKAKDYTGPHRSWLSCDIVIYDWKFKRTVVYDDQKEIVDRNLKMFQSDGFRSNWKDRYYKQTHQKLIRRKVKTEIFEYLNDSDYEVLLPLRKKDGEDPWAWH